jgi:hypothetical protein
MILPLLLFHVKFTKNLFLTRSALESRLRRHIMKKFALILTLSAFCAHGFASTAGCYGKVNGKKLNFYASGSMNNKDEGNGFVKIDGREVSKFEGSAANINYLGRKFSIRNNRGDVVEGKLHNIFNGRSTLRRLSIPGEGIEIKDVPVTCWFKK